MSAEFIYTGKVEGSLETSKNGKPVFKGSIGGLTSWVYGSAAQTLDNLNGQYALVKGLIESRDSNNGRSYPRFRVFNASPADPKHQVNLFVAQGEVEANKRIKDGLYETVISVKGNDFQNGQKVEVQYSLPISNARATDSDIGKKVTVTGRLAFRDKFTDLLGEGVAFETAPEPSEDLSLPEDEDLL